jgi:nucleotide-binding universal stress UspA family protein
VRILLAIDGSNHSSEAARALEHLARAEELIVLYVLDVPMAAYPTMVPEAARDLYGQVERQMREEGERVLSRLSSILPRSAGSVSKRIETGSPAALILNTAEKERVDLIVVGRRGVGPVHELVLGSVSHRVLTHAPCPTLVVNTPLQSLRRVLLAVQGPEDAEAAVKFLATKPFKKPVDVTVLTVLPFGQPMWSAGIAEIESLKNQALQSARHFVEEVASRLKPMQHIAAGVTRIGFPAVEIIHEAMVTDADLILMGSLARRGISRFLMGSVAHAVLHRATRPVLIFR